MKRGSIPLFKEWRSGRTICWAKIPSSLLITSLYNTWKLRVNSSKRGVLNGCDFYNNFIKWLNIRRELPTNWLIFCLHHHHKKSQLWDPLCTWIHSPMNHIEWSMQTMRFSIGWINSYKDNRKKKMMITITNMDHSTR